MSEFTRPFNPEQYADIRPADPQKRAALQEKAQEVAEGAQVVRDELTAECDGFASQSVRTGWEAVKNQEATLKTMVAMGLYVPRSEGGAEAAEDESEEMRRAAETGALVNELKRKWEVEGV